MQMNENSGSNGTTLFSRVRGFLREILQKFNSNIEDERVDNLKIGFPFWKAVGKLINGALYPPLVLFKAIREPEKTEFFIYSSCVTMSLDSLFLYVPLINHTTNYLTLDKSLMIVALILRIVTDLRYVSKIIHKIRIWRMSKESFKKLDITSNVVAILPIPQVALLVLHCLPKLPGSRSMTFMKLLNVLIVFQYVQRAYPIYRYCKNLNKLRHDTRSSHKKEWFSSSVNLLIYLIASYVLGSFWYLFSVQRVLHCWEFVDRNVTFSHSSCSLKSSNSTGYEFGIYHHAVQLGLQESRDLTTKFLVCFSWGIRNLSSFGSNLDPSSSLWEVIFVASISLSGLVLFIYFLGHVQTFMQVAGKSKMSREKLENVLRPKVDSMLHDYDFKPADEKTKNSITYLLETKHKEDPNLVFENLSSIFSIKHEVDKDRLQRELNTIREALLFDKLTTVSCGLQIDENMLKNICANFEPVTYPNGSYIIRQGEPNDMMFFITQGIAVSYTSGDTNVTKRLEKNECCSEEVLRWAGKALTTSFCNLPNSSYTVKAHKDVEIFAIQAADLQRILHAHQPNLTRAAPFFYGNQPALETSTDQDPLLNPSS